MSEITNCGVCGASEMEHAERAAETLASLFMMKQMADAMPGEYGDTLNQIVFDWRSHALPTCDPSAIS